MASSSRAEGDPDLDFAGPSTSLLPQNHSESPVREIIMELTASGRLRAYYLGIVVCMGGFLCKCLPRSHVEVGLADNAT